jgi:hypothetical protein
MTQIIQSNWVQELYSLPKWKRYSQSHEECYIHHILKNIPSINNHIVELGAWDGQHLSNTKYFIENEGYTALLIDGDNKGNQAVKQHFVTKENVVELLEKYETPKEFDFFCIDLDGNDLYIIEEVLKNYQPSLIIAEFNPIYAQHQSYTIEYNPEHTWKEDNYYGFSFEAGKKCTKKYGYTCIFQNDNLNMYFVHNKHLEYVQVPIVEYQVTNYHPHHPITEKHKWVEY